MISSMEALQMTRGQSAWHTYVFFSAQYMPAVGGVELYTQALVRELVAQGHRCTVVTSLKPGFTARETGADGVEVLRIKCPLLLNGRLPFALPGMAWREAERALDKMEIDRAVIQTRFYPLSLMGARYAAKRKIPSLVIEHGSAHLIMGGSLMERLIALYEHIFMRLVRRYCGNFFGVSAAASRWLVHFGVEAKGIIHNAAHIREIDRLLTALVCDYRTELGIGADESVVVFTGRMLKEKGIDQLVEAVKSLHGKHPLLHLVAAGDGPLLEPLKKGAPDYIHLVGRIDHPHVIALLKAADIFCLPTRSEGFTTSALEAAACGVYLIITDVGGARELTSDFQNGAQLRDARAETVAEALEQALAQPEARKAAAARARQVVQTQFSWENTALALDKAFKRIEV